MREYTINQRFINILTSIIIVYFVIFSGNVEKMLLCLLVFVIMLYRTSIINKLYRYRFLLSIAYSILLILQLFIFTNFFEYDSNIYRSILYNFIGLCIVAIPLLTEHFIKGSKKITFSTNKYLEVLSFAGLKSNVSLKDEIDNIKKLKNVLSYENISDIATDLPRHSSLRYINKDSLNKEYFNVAYENLSDPYIYIIISDTGSSASQVISLFTKTEFSHVSIAFDRELITTISYNGGERVSPPGLNQEAIDAFKKKDDASILVYGLNVGNENKYKMIKKIEQINKEGSAYNILGLVFKFSAKNNIMYCSQFVYSLLKSVNCNFFIPKDDFSIKPTDFVEKDYKRNLEFLYELKL